jgi:hypothetical protein
MASGDHETIAWALDQFRLVQSVLRRVMADGDTPFPPPTCDENHASLRAKATLARFVPRRVATSMQSAEISSRVTGWRWRLRRAVRAIVSPTHEMPPVTSVGRTYARWLALL